ncbi:MAG: type IV toxin-antitoxin system AbiEi family antitoxin domain-containing protein [Pseudohongiellaceae bacterium]
MERCTSVKTTRLCLQFGREGALSWAEKLDPDTLPTGSDRPWVATFADDLLVLKP